MKFLLASGLLAASAFSGIAGASTVCVEPWQPVSHPQVHPKPCHCPPNSPPSADCIPSHCGFNTLAQETATGGQDTFTGAAYGWALGDPGTTVSVRCHVAVNGSEVASTPTGSGTTFAETAGQVTYTATDTDTVQICSDWTSGSDSGTYCFDTSTQQVPPQEVIDLLDQVGQIVADATAGLDPLTCGALKTAGAPGLVNATTTLTTLSMDADDCDLYAAGERQLDFVPYED